MSDPDLRLGKGLKCYHREHSDMTRQKYAVLNCSTLLTLGLASLALADDQAPIPSYVVIRPPVQIKRDIVQQDYGEAEYVVPDRDPIVQKGKYWHFDMAFPDSMADLEPEKAWAQIKPSLLATGWTMFSDVPGQGRLARYQKDGHDTWLGIFVFGATDIRADLVEVAKAPLKLALQKPAGKPETVNPESGDFPYLAPLPGSRFSQSAHEDGTVLIDVDIDKDNVEQELAGDGSIDKRYTLPANLGSTLLFAEVYRDALTRSGWRVVHVIQGPHSSDAVVNAHYTADGRDIWATLRSNGSEYDIRVVDAGSGDIAKQLDRDCHVTLYGIHYDFNKATIRPDSEPTLGKILALLQARPDLRLEVQGHTDNVGNDTYNQELSNARAASVITWLSGKGIAADRLSARGYGMRVPIADNGTDEGRAKNRRVELRKQGCAN
jgi:outer membrane protein OmpA-like peptidoglycan-associated protein